VKTDRQTNQSSGEPKRSPPAWCYEHEDGDFDNASLWLFVSTSLYNSTQSRGDFDIRKRTLDFANPERVVWVREYPNQTTVISCGHEDKFAVRLAPAHAVAALGKQVR
jgi:hypothetical protein